MIGDEVQAAAKRDAAEKSLRFVETGMTVGLGTGSTARFVVEGLARLARAGLSLRTVASSEATATQARQAGLIVVGLDEARDLDLVIDGADEVDPQGRLIKGRGGALLREKVLATRAKTFVVVVDESKLVQVLGSQTALPLEVVPFAAPAIERDLAARGLRPVLRRDHAGTAVRTDQGNVLLDCATGPLGDAEALAEELDHIVGLVEHGLFLGLKPLVVVGRG
jgi:ribose 5-phosphate isomerase A